MKNVLATIFLLALTTCPEQEFKPYTNIGVQVDESKIATDPASGKKLCLGVHIVVLGSNLIIDANYCDPDGDPVTLSSNDSVNYPITVDTVAKKYRVQFTAKAVGIEYVTITAKDTPAPPLESLTRKGTYVLVTIPKNNPPQIGCGVFRKGGTS